MCGTKSIFYLDLRIKEKRLVKKDLIIVAIPFFVSHFTYLRFVRNSFGFKTFDMIAVMDSHYSIWSAFIVVTVIGWVLSFIQFRKYKIKEEPNKIIEE